MSHLFLFVIDITDDVFIFELLDTRRDFPETSIIHIFDYHSSCFRINTHDDTDMPISEVISGTIPDNNRARNGCLTCFKSSSTRIFEPVSRMSTPLDWPILGNEIGTMSRDKSSSFRIDDFEGKSTGRYTRSARSTDGDNWLLRIWEKYRSPCRKNFSKQIGSLDFLARCFVFESYGIECITFFSSIDDTVSWRDNQFLPDA